MTHPVTLIPGDWDRVRARRKVATILCAAILLLHLHEASAVTKGLHVPGPLG